MRKTDAKTLKKLPASMAAGARAAPAQAVRLPEPGAPRRAPFYGVQ